MFAPKARAILAGPTPRKVVVLAKVNDVSAYLIRTSDGHKMTVPATQLQARPEALSASHTTNEG